MLYSTSDKSLVHCSVPQQIFYRAEECMGDEIVGSLLCKENILLCTPRKYIFPHLVLRALNMDETMGFQKRENPSKRAEILVVTNRLEMLAFRETCRVNAERLFQICSNIHQYIGYCNMGIPTLLECIGGIFFTITTKASYPKMFPCTTYILLHQATASLMPFQGEQKYIGEEG